MYFFPSEGFRVYYESRLTRYLVGALLVVRALDAQAQTHHAGEGFVSIRAGTNLVGNTFRFRDRKAEPGGGGSVGVYMSQQWAFEFETWFRAANPECCGPRQAESLLSVSVMRLLVRAGLQPYMLGGMSLVNARRRELQVQVGVGVQFPVYRRLGMAVDLRGNGGGSTMIVRPTVAAIYYFR
jgi:hypothetical protein